MNNTVTIEREADGEIRTWSCGQCLLCHAEGRPLYFNQSDRLFGAAGSWTLKQCPNNDCQLIWLDPMPVPEDISRAYNNYYTHAPVTARATGVVKPLYQAMKRGYLATRYSYGAPRAWKMLGRLLYLFPLRRSDVDDEVRFLQAIPQGRLLDVGCGSGDWLQKMHRLDWQVEGVDFDENAVRIARQHGFNVGCGAIEDQGYESDSFDVVTLNHVIEHLPDPIGALTECRRILKAKGTLVVSTPNTSSLGHRFFRKDWRGLEPPRHLHLFSSHSLHALLKRAGFEKITLRPQISDSVICESILLRTGKPDRFDTAARSRSAVLFARMFNIVERILALRNVAAAECVTAITIKE